MQATQQLLPEHSVQNPRFLGEVKGELTQPFARKFEILKEVGERGGYVEQVGTLCAMS